MHGLGLLIGTGLLRGGYQRMLPVDPVLHLAVTLCHVPHGGATGTRQAPSAAGHHAARAESPPLHQCLQTLTERCRQLGGGLVDGDLPVVVQRVRDIDLHAQQLGKLGVGLQPEPGPGDDEPAVAVDIEPLVPDEPALASQLALLLEGEPAEVRQRPGTDHDRPGRQHERLLLPHDGRGVIATERIDALHPLTVQEEGKAPARRLARQELVEHEREPTTGVRDGAIEPAGIEGSPLAQPIAPSPQHLRARAFAEPLRGERLDLGRLEHGHAPSIDRLQVPARPAAGLGAGPGKHGELGALGERRGLQAPSEATQVPGVTFGRRVRAGGAHGPHQRGLVHAAAVVPDPHRRAGVLQHAVDVHAPGSGVDAVVDEVGQGRGQVVVAEAPRGEHQRTRVGRVVDVPHPILFRRPSMTAVALAGPVDPAARLPDGRIVSIRRRGNGRSADRSPVGAGEPMKAPVVDPMRCHAAGIGNRSAPVGSVPRAPCMPCKRPALPSDHARV